PWLAPLRNAMPLGVLVTMVLMLPALGIALVKPSVVGTTARASKENVRSIGYSIYYTLVNIGGAAGPYVASWVHQHMRVENVFRVAALSVFVMFFAVLLFFKEPRRSGETQTVSLGQAARNFGTVISNPRFMIFLLWSCMDPADHASHDSNGSCHLIHGVTWIDYPIPALLRIYFPSGAFRTARNIHGLCVSTNRNRLIYRWVVRREAHSSFWRG